MCQPEIATTRMLTPHCSQPQYGSRPQQQRVCRIAAALAIVGLFASGCDPLSLTMVGVGTATGVQHTLNGISYRTFTASLPEVRAAALTALNRMGVKDSARRKTAEGETITAKAGERDIEIELDAITPKTTRMRTTVRNGMLMDSATGIEIIVQTGRALNNGKETST